MAWIKIGLYNYDSESSTEFINTDASCMDRNITGLIQNASKYRHI